MVEISDLCRNVINKGKQELIMASIQVMSRGHAQTPKQVLQRDKTCFKGRDDQPGDEPSLRNLPGVSAQACKIQNGHTQAQECHRSVPEQNATVSEKEANFTQDSADICDKNTLFDIASWNNPQIYLAAAASGKSAIPYYDITDFVAENTQKENVIACNDLHQGIFISGPQKVKLENVTLDQWSVANLAILHKLVGEEKLKADNILDYLSYTTKICELAQRFSLISVWLYDREYRKLQATHSFRWGTDLPHLLLVHLQNRVPRQGPVKPKHSRHNPVPPKKMHKATPMTLDGKVICRLYNAKSGCKFDNLCKFAHQCSKPGCYQWHSAFTHHQPKNM